MAKRIVDLGKIKGADGTGIASVAQTTTSTESGGANVVTVTLTNGDKSTFQVRNGAVGGNGYVTAGQMSGTTLGERATAEGIGVTSSGKCSHGEGMYSEATNDGAHAEGSSTEASGGNSHSEGSGTKASGPSSHSEGGETEASGRCSHAQGWSTEASGDYSFSQGRYTKATAHAAFASGERSVANGSYSSAFGQYTSADNIAQMAIGSCNTANIAGYLVVGNGRVRDDTPVRSNCFRVTTAGVYAAGEYASTGADYAEYFQWADGNPNREDRRGRFVTLEGETIRLAGPEDEDILGIVTGNPSVVGDAHDDQWHGMYLTDIYGSPIWEDVEVPAETAEDGTVLLPARVERRRKLNPEYDNTQAYLPRSERPEWAAVGMLGKLVVDDDGTCQVNGWATVGANGAATASLSRTGCRVLARLDDTHVKVLVK